MYGMTDSIVGQNAREKMQEEEEETENVKEVKSGT